VGHRSGFEERIAGELERQGIEPNYEVLSIPYTPPRSTHQYTPDFLLPNGILIETKGYFLPEDRAKHKHIKAEHPDLDIRFVFQNPKSPIRKGSPTSYAKWCEKEGFVWAARAIPQDWLKEPPEPKRLKAIETVAVMKKQKSKTNSKSN